MKHEGQIDYTLTINDKGEHGISYKTNLENDIAGLMIAAQVLEHNLVALREGKEGASGHMKKALGKQISKMSVTLADLTILAKSLCDSYEHYKSLQSVDK